MAHERLSVSLSALAGDWQWAPIPLCAGALAVLLYASGVRRLRARGRPDLSPTSQALLFGAGIALALLVLVSPSTGPARTTSSRRTCCST